MLSTLVAPTPSAAGPARAQPAGKPVPKASGPPSKPGGGSAGRPPGSRPPRPIAGSAECSRQAKQRAAAILEVLAGARTPTDAAVALGVSLPRYYLLEEKALAGLLAACEPQPCGRQPDVARRYEALERECARWQRDCARQQALLRAAQRSIGLAAPAPAPPVKTPGKRRRRPTVRALRAAARLRPDPPAEDRPEEGKEQSAGSCPSTAAPLDS